LAFLHNNYWKNAQFESEMLIAKALGLKKIYETYKKGVLMKTSNHLPKKLEIVGC
jgi:hypothetical protein